MSDEPRVVREIQSNNTTTWLSWSHDGQRLLHGSLVAPVVYIRDLNTGQRKRFVCAGPTTAGDWSHDDAYVSVVEKTRITVRDSKTGSIVRERETFLPKFAVWNPESYLLAINDGDDVKIFDGKTFQGGRSWDFSRGGDFVAAAWRGASELLIAQRGAVTILPLEGDARGSMGGCYAIAAHGELIVIADSIGITVSVENGEYGLGAWRTPAISVSISADDTMLAVLHEDGMIHMWGVSTGNLLASWQSSATSYNALQFSPQAPILAVTSERSIIFYDCSNLTTTKQAVRYTTAKIALVGDSGVGKSGLASVLTEDKYIPPTSSTHGEQFRIAERLSTTREDGTRCEAVVWDLAGQSDYRLIHSLFIDDADVALVVFDPTAEPLKGAEFWLRALHASREKRCRTVLVAGRIDRGVGVLTDDEVAAFVKAHAIEGGYVATSAERGDGVATLTERIAQLIDWDSRPATVTIDTFKEIRDRVLELKEQQSGNVLWTMDRLQQWLHETTGTTHAVDDIDTAVRHLAHHGYVRPLRSSAGERFVLLSPNLLNNLAASMVLEARRNPKGLGALEERRVLAGGYAFPELEPLAQRDRELVLDAATTLFIERNLCFRETLGNDTFLIFPSLINQNKPPLEIARTVEGTAYTARGATENVYASLVVLLGYTNTFTRTNQWRNQAQYEMGEGEICGFRLTDEREGEIDLVLYFGETTASSTRLLFQGLFEKFLHARRVEVEIFPPVACPKCSYPQPRSEVVKRQRDHEQKMFCSNCGARVPLGRAAVSPARQRDIAESVEDERQVAARRTAFEKAVTWLKGYLRDTQRRAPSCFISYAWGDTAQERWIERQLATDLRNAGVEVILDRWHNKPGADIARFIERIERADFVTIVGTKRMRRKYDSKTTDPVLGAELRLINQRLMKRESESSRVVPLLLDGTPSTSFPPLAKGSMHLDFREDSLYFERMFDLLLTLYGIPPDEPAMRDPRDIIAAATPPHRR